MSTTFDPAFLDQRIVSFRWCPQARGPLRYRSYTSSTAQYVHVKRSNRRARNGRGKTGRLLLSCSPQEYPEFVGWSSYVSCTTRFLRRNVWPIILRRLPAGSIASSLLLPRNGLGAPRRAPNRRGLAVVYPSFRTRQVENYDASSFGPVDGAFASPQARDRVAPARQRVRVQIRQT